MRKDHSRVLLPDNFTCWLREWDGRAQPKNELALVQGAICRRTGIGNGNGQCVNEVLLAQEVVTAGGQLLDQSLILDGHAHATHEPDIDDGSREILPVTVVDECIQERVCGVVVCLTPLPCDTADRGKKKEEIQFERTRSFVQIPSPLDFGLHALFPLGKGHV